MSIMHIHTHTCTCTCACARHMCGWLVIGSGQYILWDVFVNSMIPFVSTLLWCRHYNGIKETNDAAVLERKRERDVGRGEGGGEKEGREGGREGKRQTDI